MREYFFGKYFCWLAFGPYSFLVFGDRSGCVGADWRWAVGFHLCLKPVYCFLYFSPLPGRRARRVDFIS